MSSTTTKPTDQELAQLKANMDNANARLQKAVRKALRNGQTPEVFKSEKLEASKAYRAYWDAADRQ
jgi:hypothetical protein